MGLPFIMHTREPISRAVGCSNKCQSLKLGFGHASVLYNRTYEKGHTQKAGSSNQIRISAGWLQNLEGISKAAVCTRWARILHLPPHLKHCPDLVLKQRAGSWEEGGWRMREREFDRKDVTESPWLLPVSIIFLFPPLTLFPSVCLHTSVWLLLPALGGCDVWISSSVADDLHCDTLHTDG